MHYSSFRTYYGADSATVYWKIAQYLPLFPSLGGNDIEEMLAQHIHARVTQESGVPKAFEDMFGSEQNQIFERREDAKKRLSIEDFVPIRLMRYGEKAMLRYSISLEEFQKLTSIKRLRRLIESGDPDWVILVLCFSQNAVHVIRERLRQEIGSSIDALIAEERLIIRTFDSFATYMLADDLPKGLDYDQRIKLFIEKMTEHPDILDGVEYLIVDEVQDTIGVRARMLRAMIEQGDFGVLLSGDRCQAIYDWSIRGANDWISTDLYDWIGGSGFQICGLEENHRQGLAVSRLGDAVRRSLLGGSEEEQEQTLTLCKEKIEALWPECKIQYLPQKLLRQSELILCRTSGEAAVMSDLLFGGSRFVEHTMMQSANHRSLAPWIGMILGGCTAPVVSKGEFTARAQARGIDEIETKWDALMSLRRGFCCV